MTGSGVGAWAWAWAVVVPVVAAGGWWLAAREEQARRRARLLREMAGPVAAPPGRGRVRIVLARACRVREELARRSGPLGRCAAASADPALLVVPIGLLLSWVTGSPVPVLGAVAAVRPLRRARRRSRTARARERRQDEIAELASGLAGELRSGATPEQALRMVAGEQGRPELVAAARYGGDVPEALRALAAQPGAEGAAGIAACWQVAAERGAGLAAGLDRIAESLRADRALRETVRAELAGARSTAVLLAALPGFALTLGASLGADPLHVLLHTPAGLACLALGVLLEAAGLRWTARIIRTAEGAPGAARWPRPP